jgi:hypothetical protein
MTAQSAGCTTSTRDNSAASSPVTASVSDQSTNGANADSHAVIDAANSGHVAINSRPIPSHCEP